MPKFIIKNLNIYKSTPILKIPGSGLPMPGQRFPYLSTSLPNVNLSNDFKPNLTSEKFRKSSEKLSHTL